MAPACLLALLAGSLAAVSAQTYTNENLPGVNAYSAFSGYPTASVYAPWSGPFTAATPVAGASPTQGGCTGVGGTCVPVSVAGSASAGYWLTRGSGAAAQAYWFKCVPDRGTRARLGVLPASARASLAGVFRRPGARGSAWRRVAARRVALRPRAQRRRA